MRLHSIDTISSEICQNGKTWPRAAGVPKRKGGFAMGPIQKWYVRHKLSSLFRFPFTETIRLQRGMVGGGGDKSEDRSSHVAAPLSSLKDPSTFAPPPKRDPAQPLPAPIAYSPVSASPQPGSRPAPAIPARSQTQNSYAGQQEGVSEAPPAPSRGWQRDTTGLSTAHLPPPPGRRDGADGRIGSPAQSPVASLPYSATTPRALVAPAKGPPPSLPPRLPPRSGTTSPVRASSPAIPARSATQTHLDTQGRAENGFLNQGAASRLGAAGISVPGFGIGGKSSPAPPSRSPIAPPASAETPASSQGTTWQQKQTALRTASQFNKDPSSVSFSDARAAASTANNFRQRHGEQVAGGLRTAHSLGQRFGVAEQKSQEYEASASGTGNQQQRGGVSVSSLTSAIGKKKPPAPPPPRKKAELSSGPVPNGNAGAPPPVPMSTRPTF